MTVRGKHLSRRALLRGVGGAAIALPFLDAMHPAMAAERNTAAAPVRRLGIVFFPHGVLYEKWTPAGDSGPLQMTPGLKPLERHRDNLTVIAGLTSWPDRTKVEFHDRATATWLTGVDPVRVDGKLRYGISMDQLAAKTLGRDTRIASLELGTEQSDYRVGDICFKDADTRLPLEQNPRVLFERLFGEGSKIDPQATALRNASDRSTLDAVMEQIGGLKRKLGPADVSKLDQYLDSIRDLERRIQIAESTPAPALPEANRPSGAPVDRVEYVKMMFDLQVLAYQADITRVSTFMTQRDGSNQMFPNIGINMQHHAFSHHNNDAVKLDYLHRVNVFQSEMFAYYLDKLDAVKEASGSLLDNSVILHGSDLSNPDMHSQRDLPIMVAGGAAGALKGGRFIRAPGDPPPWPFAAKWETKSPTPLTNLHVALLNKVGVPTETFGDSTGAISL